jgi:hypothetical protein
MDSIKLLYFLLLAIFWQTICTNAYLYPIEARLPLKVSEKLKLICDEF